MHIGKRTLLLIIGILIAGFFGISLIYRISLPYDQVFVGNWIKFTSIDAYYQMLIVDNLAYNFPHLTPFTPFLIYPGGGGFGEIHFFNWFIAIIAWIIGLGSPTQHVVDVVAVYFPAILAALTIIPVYFIGKALFNRWAGVIAAALVAIFAGEYMGRSILGFTDQHVAETLFTTVAALFLILAIKTAGERQLTFSHIIQRDWKTITRPLVYSLLAGIFLGIYLITWLGGLLFVFIITIYFVIQFIIDHLKHKSTAHLGIIGFIMFLVALIIFWPFSPAVEYIWPIGIAILIPLVLAGISMIMSGFNLKTYYYPLALVGIAVIFLGIFYAIAPSAFNWAISKFSIFNPTGATATTTIEMQPFLSPQGSFSTGVAWGNFTTSFFLAPNWPIPGFAFISFAILIWLFVKHRGDDEKLLFFLIWNLIIFVLTLIQRRFAYYLVINIALLSAYLSWQAIWLAGLRKLAVKTEKEPGKEQHYPEAASKRDYYEILGVARNASHKDIKKAFNKLSLAYRPDRNRSPEAEEKFKEINKAFEVLSNFNRRTEYDQSLHQIAIGKPEKKHAKRQGWTIYHTNAALAVVIVFFFVLFPNIMKAKEVAALARYAPSDAWQESMDWMRENTPEPFGDPDAYYSLYEPPPYGETFTYPESAYGVTSWWDYGYWISRTAHRIPNANPSQDPKPITKIATLFLSDDESQRHEIMEQLDSSYIISDYAMATSKFWAIVTWSGRNQDEFIGTYIAPYQNQYVTIQVFYPEYYRTLLVRLNNFDGKAVPEGKPAVISYEERYDSSGMQYRLVNNIEEFSTYQEALDYINGKDPGNYSIVGVSPFTSPIPLEEVPDFKLTYSSKPSVPQQDGEVLSEVKIFEYTK